MPTVIIGADICPIEGNLPFFIKGDVESLFHDLLPEFKGVSLAIANLECPFIQGHSPIAKTGPNFGVDGACINAIKAAGIDVLCLANNHIMDHGVAGLRHTLEVCSRAGVATVGAGENLEEARRILISKVGGLRIGILAVTEHEFSIAGKSSPGACPVDLIDMVRNIRKCRNSVDYLIILLHGGDEFLVPSPRIQDTCRFLVEMGANAVIVQHPHVLGGYEDYQGGHIIYGQGALIMDEAVYRNRKSFHEGFLVKLSVAPDASSNMDIIPFTQSDPVPGARALHGQQEQVFRCTMAERSKAILDPAFVEAEWVEFCNRLKHGYLSGLLGYTRALRKLNKHGHVSKALHGKRELLGVKNIVCCETHREAIETIFNHGLLQSSRHQPML